MEEASSQGNKRRCPFCHEWVDDETYARHQKEHTQLRPDGQMNEYITLPPEERTMDSLRGVPRVYCHDKCDACTEMPEEIIRSYLKNPFFYSDFTYCCGCRKHVPCRELTWVETGENMQAYNNRLRNQYRRNRFLGFWHWLMRIFGKRD